nr:hypothetical protein [Lachnospiraceae bacterium]
MKNQYFGDIGDYGKYGMLHFLAQHKVSVAVNWYLTEDDGSNDGRHIDYLDKDDFWKYDPEVYRHLKEYVVIKKQRDVSLFETSGLIPDSAFYSRVLEAPQKYTKQDRERIRDEWHKKGLETCAGKALVFLDPDNGYRKDFPKAVKDQSKYCYEKEVRDYYDSGADVVFYTSRGRRNNDKWAEAKQQMIEAAPGAALRMLTFHKGTQRSFVYVIHPGHEEKYDRLL